FYKIQCSGSSENSNSNQHGNQVRNDLYCYFKPLFCSINKRFIDIYLLSNCQYYKYYYNKEENEITYQTGKCSCLLLRKIHEIINDAHNSYTHAAQISQYHWLQQVNFLKN